MNIAFGKKSGKAIKKMKFNNGNSMDKFSVIALNHTKDNVIRRLSLWFPNFALNLNIDWIRKSIRISVSNVQFMFWEQILLQIENGDKTFKLVLSEAVKCRGPSRLLTPRPTAEFILWDLVFLSHVDYSAIPLSVEDQKYSNVMLTRTILC